jgi:hypothetical protein
MRMERWFYLPGRFGIIRPSTRIGRKRNREILKSHESCILNPEIGQSQIGRSNYKVLISDWQCRIRPISDSPTVDALE